MKVCVFEDDRFREFFPLTYLRPVFCLRAGIVPLFLRLKRLLGESDLCLICREQVAPLAAKQFPDYPVNIVKRGENEDVLFVNGRLRDPGNLLELIRSARVSTRFVAGDAVAAVLFKSYALDGLPPLVQQQEYQKLFAGQEAHIASDDTSAELYGHLWDIMADIEPEIEADFEHLSDEFGEPQDVFVAEGAYLVDEENIHLAEGVQVMPTAVIDASSGPVYVARNVRIEPHAAILGPCYIGPDSVVLSGKVAGSSIGPVCRVGGEVEESIFLSHVNKYHAGFIGHSVVGPWVNFGAMTTNSDLKNNYSEIRVSLDGRMTDTGSIKVGSFIGDHTKFGIGTLLNTGINIGICCNVFGGGLVMDKEVPSFMWGATGSWQKYRLDKVVETARKVAERRGAAFSAREEAVLRDLSEGRINDEGIMRF